MQKIKQPVRKQKRLGKTIKQIVVIVFLQLGSFASNACVCHTEPLTEAKLSTFKNILVAKIITLIDTVTNDMHLRNSQIAKIEPLEIFKGNNIKKVLITSVQSSCDLGIRQGDVWIFFLNDLNEIPAVLPCGYNTAYLSEKYQQLYFVETYLRGVGTLLFLRNSFTDKNFKRSICYNWLNKKNSYSYQAKDGVLHGLYVLYDENGNKIIESKYENGKLKGEKQIWYKSGKLRSIENYENNMLTGKKIAYYPTGIKQSEIFYNNGNRHGAATEWDEFGNIIFSGTYSEGKTKDTAWWWHKIDTAKRMTNIEPLVLFDRVSADSLYKWNQTRKLERMIVNDSSGKLIHNISFYRNGTLESETNFEANSGIYIKHAYHFNGITKEIQIYRIDTAKNEYEGYDTKYIYEEFCFGNDGKRIRKRFFDKNGEKVIKAVDIQNGIEIIVYPAEK